MGRRSPQLRPASDCHHVVGSDCPPGRRCRGLRRRCGLRQRRLRGARGRLGGARGGLCAIDGRSVVVAQQRERCDSEDGGAAEEDPDAGRRRAGDDQAGSGLRTRHDAVLAAEARLLEAGCRAARKLQILHDDGEHHLDGVLEGVVVGDPLQPRLRPPQVHEQLSPAEEKGDDQVGEGVRRVGRHARGGNHVAHRLERGKCQVEPHQDLQVDTERWVQVGHPENPGQPNRGPNDVQWEHHQCASHIV
mmetsp:Transcript_107549/g.304046  ORF Transcript_107549/g.304046 Transcript_107549/m.304046 type:complete len:247 (-) Transcript_107549:1255-1995(-)